MSVVLEVMCFVNWVDRRIVGSNIALKRVVMSWDLWVPRKSVRKKYSLEALSMSV